VWLSPKNAKKQMEAIKDAFVKADPENKEYYEKNFEDNVKSLTILTENTEKNWRSIQKGYCCGTSGLRIFMQGIRTKTVCH